MDDKKKPNEKAMLILKKQKFYLAQDFPLKGKVVILCGAEVHCLKEAGDHLLVFEPNNEFKFWVPRCILRLSITF